MQFGQKTSSGKDPKRANRVLKPTSTGHSVHRRAGNAEPLQIHTKVQFEHRECQFLTFRE